MAVNNVTYYLFLKHSKTKQKVQHCEVLNA